MVPLRHTIANRSSLASVAYGSAIIFAMRPRHVTKSTGRVVGVAGVGVVAVVGVGGVAVVAVAVAVGVVDG